MTVAGREGSVLLELVFGYAGMCCLRITAELNLHFCPALHQATQYSALFECFFPGAPMGQVGHSGGNDRLTLSREASKEHSSKAGEQLRAFQAPGSHLLLSLAEAPKLWCTAGPGRQAVVPVIEPFAPALSGISNFSSTSVGCCCFALSLQRVWLGGRCVKGY